MEPITAAEVRDLREQTGMGLYEARDHLMRERLVAELGKGQSPVLNALRYLLNNPNLNGR